MGGQTPNKKFLNKRWSVASINRLIKKIDNSGSAERKSGSAGRPRSLRTADNFSMIQDMIFSQDNAPCSQTNPRKIQEHIDTATSLEYFLFSALQLLLWLLTDHNIN